MASSSDDIQEHLLELMNRTGYPIIQENGQRKFGPPPDWQSGTPVRGSEVFVCKLPREIYEYHLVPIFEKVGRIYELRLMMDYNGANRGFAFICFSNPQEAKKAIEEFNDFEILPKRRIYVLKSTNNCRLFVGNIPKIISRQDILDELEQLTEGIIDVILYRSMVDKSKNRGFAFVEYENHRAAVIARRKLIPGPVLWGVKLAVDWAQPEPDVDEDTMSKVTILYVRNLNLRTSELDLRQHFEDVIGMGQITKVKRLRDFAFIHFTNRQAAEQGLAVDGHVIDGAEIEVTWAKPPSSKRASRIQIQSNPREISKRPPKSNWNPPPMEEPLLVTTPLSTPGFDGFQVPLNPFSMNTSPCQDRESGSPREAPTHGQQPNERRLNVFCVSNGLGVPVVDVTPIRGTRNENLYFGKVTLPYFGTEIRSPVACATVESAKSAAAEFALHLLNFQLQIPVSPGFFSPYENRGCLAPALPPLVLPMSPGRETPMPTGFALTPIPGPGRLEMDPQMALLPMSSPQACDKGCCIKAQVFDIQRNQP